MLRAPRRPDHDLPLERRHHQRCGGPRVQVLLEQPRIRRKRARIMHVQHERLERRGVALEPRVHRKHAARAPTIRAIRSCGAPPRGRRHKSSSDWVEPPRLSHSLRHDPRRSVVGGERKREHVGASWRGENRRVVARPHEQIRDVGLVEEEQKVLGERGGHGRGLRRGPKQPERRVGRKRLRRRVRRRGRLMQKLRVVQSDVGLRRRDLRPHEPVVVGPVHRVLALAVPRVLARVRAHWGDGAVGVDALLELERAAQSALRVEDGEPAHELRVYVHRRASARAPLVHERDERENAHREARRNAHRRDGLRRQLVHDEGLRAARRRCVARERRDPRPRRRPSHENVHAQLDWDVA